MLTGILTGLSWLSTIWFAAHMLDHRARLYWLAGMTAWVEGVEWLTGELRTLLCGFALGIWWRSRDLDDWLLARSLWVFREFHRGRIRRRAELLEAFGLHRTV